MRPHSEFQTDVNLLRIDMCYIISEHTHVILNIFHYLWNCIKYLTTCSMTRITLCYKFSLSNQFSARIVSTCYPSLTSNWQFVLSLPSDISNSSVTGTCGRLDVNSNYMTDKIFTNVRVMLVTYLCIISNVVTDCSVLHAMQGCNKRGVG